MTVVEVSYRVTADADERAIAGDLRLLSADERRRCEQFMFAADRRDYAAAHALLRRRLSAAGPLAPEAWTFETMPTGKPRVSPSCGVGAELAFNLSHTRGLVACAVGRGIEVGIDVEAIRATHDWMSVAGYAFTAGEISWIAAVPVAGQPARFVALWTLKEAWLKATAAGLTGRLDGCSFSFGDDGEIVFQPPAEIAASEWTFTLVEPAPDYRLALAVRSTSDDRAIARMVMRNDAACADASA